MENKKTYTAPEMEIIVFACADGTDDVNVVIVSIHGEGGNNTLGT